MTSICGWLSTNTDQSHSKPTTHHIESKDELDGVDGLKDEHQELIDRMIESHTQLDQQLLASALASATVLLCHSFYPLCDACVRAAGAV